MTEFFYLLDQIFMLSSHKKKNKRGRKIFIICSSPSIKVSNFTSGWVQYRARKETRDNRAMTSIQKRKFHHFSIPQFFSCAEEENCVDRKYEWDC